MLLKRKYPRFCREKKGFSNRFPQRGNALERSYMSKKKDRRWLTRLRVVRPIDARPLAAPSRCLAFLGLRIPPVHWWF